MNPAWKHKSLAVVVTVIGAASVASAQEGRQALPTLLIKGEVMSIDTNDPTAALLTVKDRYGFETPIYITSEAAVTQGQQPLEPNQLAPGMNVEVEYNFDINTAKRHAVSVVVSEPEPDAAASEPAEAPRPMPTPETVPDASPPAPDAGSAAPVAEPSASPEQPTP